MFKHLNNIIENRRRKSAVSYAIVIPALIPALLLSAVTVPSAHASLLSCGVMAATYIARGVHPYAPAFQQQLSRPADAPDYAKGEDKPIVIHAEPAVYPDSARQVGFEGTVEVLVSIDRHGRVSETEIIWSDASRLLEAAAETAAAKFIFRPACQYDLQIPCQVIVPFMFVLE